MICRSWLKVPARSTGTDSPDSCTKAACKGLVLSEVRSITNSCENLCRFQRSGVDQMLCHSASQSSNSVLALEHVRRQFGQHPWSPLLPSVSSPILKGAQRPHRTLSMNFASLTEDACVSFSRSSTSPLLFSIVGVICLIISCTLCGVAQLPFSSISRDWRNCATKSASVDPIGGAFAFTGLGGFGCASSSYRSNSLSMMEGEESGGPLSRAFWIATQKWLHLRIGSSAMRMGTSSMSPPYLQNRRRSTYASRILHWH